MKNIYISPDLYSGQRFWVDLGSSNVKVMLLGMINMNSIKFISLVPEEALKEW